MNFSLALNKKQLNKLFIFLLVECWLCFLNPLVNEAMQIQNKGWVPDYDKRDQWQQPEKILDSIGIKQGMTVADVGAGTGYLTLRIAKRVGEKGIVYATDIREGRINALKNKALKAGFENIITLLSTETDTGLPRDTFDIIIMLHVIHIVIKEQDPLAFLANLKLALKPDGILVIVHWDGPKMGYPEVEAYSQENVLKLFKDSGFTMVRTETFLPRDTIFILKPVCD